MQVRDEDGAVSPDNEVVILFMGVRAIAEAEHRPHHAPRKCLRYRGGRSSRRAMMGKSAELKVGSQAGGPQVTFDQRWRLHGQRPVKLFNGQGATRENLVLDGSQMGFA